jgi:phosphopantothenoylcysteine synthetase/decarboxylase
MVGFSLDRNQQLKRGKEKLKKKGLDLIVLNEPGVLGKDRIKARIVKKSGHIIKVGTMSKWQLANKILDHCLDAMDHKKQRKG